MGQALAGLRLLDLSRQLPGQYCSMLPADLGMEVTIISAPGDGAMRGEGERPLLGAPIKLSASPPYGPDACPPNFSERTLKCGNLACPASCIAVWNIKACQDKLAMP